MTSTSLFRATILALAMIVAASVLLPVTGARAVGGGIDQRVDDYRSTNPSTALAGAVINEQGVTTFARGEADERTRFRIASMTKSFTAALVMIEADRGRMELDAPLTTYIPEFGLADPRYTRITLRMLLAHTSGMSDSDYPELDLPAPGDGAELLAELSAVGLQNDPGSTHDYLNTNYALLALALERVGGDSYERILQTELLAPLGMADTTSVVGCDAPVAGVGSGHAVVLRQPVPVNEPGGFCLGNGGIVSSAVDMASWLQFQIDGGLSASGVRVLSEASMREIWTPQPGTLAGGGGYGLGWGIGPLDDGYGVISHSGALAGWSSDMVLAAPQGRPNGVGVVVLSDTAGSPGDLSQALLADATGRPGPEPSGEAPILLDLVMLGACVLVLGLGVLGAWRASRWADRHPGRIRRVYGIGWPLLVAGLGVGLPPLFALALGVPLNWLGSWVYTSAMFPLISGFAMLLILSGASVALTRIAATRNASARIGSAGSRSATDRPLASA